MPDRNRLIQPLMISVLLVTAFLVRWVVAPSNGYMQIEGGFQEYKQAMHRALTLGTHEIYTANAQNDPAMTGKEWQGGYFVTNPPARLYTYFPSVLVYRHFSPEGFELWNSNLNFFDMKQSGLKRRFASSRGFSVALKLPAMIADIGIALIIFLFIKRHLAFLAAFFASAIYAFTPGVVIDSSHYGSHDAVAILFLVLSLLAVNRGWIEVAAALFVLAALNKPQAAAFLPFMVFLGLWRFSVRRVVQATVIAVATAALVFLPFILHGTFEATLSALIHATFGGEPFISMDACNLWWLLSLGKGQEIPDTILLFNTITLRTLGLLMFLLANFYVMTRLRLVEYSSPRMFLGAAFIGMAYFMLNTEVHENHMISVLPLLLLALPCSRIIWGVVTVLAITLSMNFILFDSTFFPALGMMMTFHKEIQSNISVTVAAVNLGIFLTMAWLLYREASKPVSDPNALMVLKMLSRLQIAALLVVAVMLYASFNIANPKKILKEYRVQLRNPSITKREDVMRVIEELDFNENLVAGFAKKRNLTPEDLLRNVVITLDFPQESHMMVIKVTITDDDTERMNQLDALFIEGSNTLQEALDHYPDDKL